MANSLSFIILSLCLLFVVNSHAAEQLAFGQVFNMSFPENTEYLDFEVEVPYNPMVPPAQRVAILTYIPYEPLNVSASFDPTFTNQYTGSNKDGNYIRGIVWVDNLPMNTSTLYIRVTKAEAMVYNFFGLNIEWPDVLTKYPKELRYETVMELEPWQTKWILVNYPDDEEQFFSAVRGEFCDEPQGEVSMSLIFAEAPAYDEDIVVNPCGCDDVIIEDRSVNVITRFTDHAQQMFLLPSAVAAGPVYAGLFYLGPDPVPSLTSAYARKRSNCPSSQHRRTARAHGRSLRDDEEFSMRITLWGQELFPTVRTKYTKPDRVNDDLLANVDDTPYCDFWASSNFSAYVSDFEYFAFDSACFLEKYADNFTVYHFETLVGNETQDKVIVIQDFYSESKEKNDTYFNIVHSNEDCGSYAYFFTEVPTEGWELEKPPVKKTWTSAAIGLVVLFGFLFIVFFIASVLLISRLREFTRYRKI